MCRSSVSSSLMLNFVFIENTSKNKITMTVLKSVHRLEPEFQY